MAYLSASNLTKSYGRIAALKGFSFEVKRGEIFALVGPDGAGKTTTISILCHLIDADSGSAIIDNKDVFTQFRSIKPLLGYMPQSFSLYPDLSVEENLEFYSGIFGVTGDAFRKKRDYLYTFSNLAPFANRRASALSGGMKQKLALSCALVHEPQILILDEPTTGVDPLSRRQFWEILLDLKRQGAAILVTTPYMDEVEHADRACFIFGGRKLAQGTPSQLAKEFRGKVYFLDSLPNAELTKQLNEINGLSARRFGAGMHLHIGRQANIDDFVPQLESLGIDARRLVVTEPSLEDRFIELMEQSS